MVPVPLILSLVGLVLLVWRMTPRGWDGGGLRTVAAPSEPSELPLVTIIIPARNEEATLPPLLTSLAVLRYPRCEVIVVDDQSTDATAAVATRWPGVTVIRGQERPAGWAGKQWACHQGAARATGAFLLFTDADTVHRPDGLAAAVGELTSRGADVLTALPYHKSDAWWDRLTGPFHVLLLALTAPYGRPVPGRVFAIGQYLLFRREAYDRIGGHGCVPGTLVEDLPLANACLEAGLGYVVHRGPPPCEVRMYASFGAFVAGWRRNFRAGFAYASPRAGLDATLMLAPLLAGGDPNLATLVVMGLALTFIAWRQQTLGRFSTLGPLVWPLSVALFIGITGLALGDLLLGRGVIWRGRTYPSPVGTRP